MGINEYYDAWKLRGDNPQLYQNGYFKIKGEVYEPWDKYAINREFPVNYKIRYKPEVAMLYYAYHFNPEVKKAGDEMIEVKVHPNFNQGGQKNTVKNAGRYLYAWYWDRNKSLLQLSDWNLPAL